MHSLRAFVIFLCINHDRNVLSFPFASPSSGSVLVHELIVGKRSPLRSLLAFFAAMESVPGHETGIVPIEIDRSRVRQQSGRIFRFRRER